MRSRRRLVSRQARHKLMLIAVRRSSYMMFLSYFLRNLLSLNHINTPLIHSRHLRSRRNLLITSLLNRVIISSHRVTMCKVQRSHTSNRHLSNNSLLHLSRHFQVSILNIIHMLFSFQDLNLHSYRITKYNRLLNLQLRFLRVHLRLNLMVNLHLNYNLLICRSILNHNLSLLARVPSAVINGNLTSRRLTVLRHNDNVAFNNFNNRSLNRRLQLYNRHRPISNFTIVFRAGRRAIQRRVVRTVSLFSIFSNLIKGLPNQDQECNRVNFRPNVRRQVSQDLHQHNRRTRATSGHRSRRRNNYNIKHTAFQAEGIALHRAPNRNRSLQ